MKKKTPYPKWVGLPLGLLLTGSAHYLSGKHAIGLVWYFGLVACGSLALILAAIPGTISYIFGMTLVLSGIILWFGMLKQSYRPVPRIGFLGWIAVIVLSLILNTFVKFAFRQIVYPFKVPTTVMAPTIIPGDHILVERFSYRFVKPKRGDIVVYSTDNISYSAVPPDTFFINRVAGLPGESIQIQPPHLLINGIKVDVCEKAMTYALHLTYDDAPIQPALAVSNDVVILGENEYFLIGDNTPNSIDSRYFGSVSAKSIIGKATRIYYPFTRINKLK